MPSNARSNTKFMQSLNAASYQRLERIAKEKGVSIQELMRAVVIPEWLKKNGNSELASKVKR